MSAANVPLATTSLDAERRAYEPSMEEILASIRKIIADDDSLPAMREANRRPLDDLVKPLDQPAAPAQEKVAATQEIGELSATREPAHVLAPRVDRWPRPLYRPELRSPPIAAAKDEPRSGVFDNWRGKSITEELTAATQNLRSDARPSDMAKSNQSLDSDHDEPDEAKLDGETSDHSADDSARRAVAPPSEDVAAPVPEAAERQPLVSPDAAASVAAHFQALAASMVINDSNLLQRYAEEMLRPMLKQWLDDNLPVLVEKLVRAEIERVARGRR